MTISPATFASDEPAHRWREPSRSVATRRTAESPRWSGRPILVEPNDNRELLGESELEAKAALVLLARPDCARLFEQPEPVRYRDHEGKRCHHTFDFLLVLRSGRKIAVAVKPQAIADKRGLKALITHIAGQMDPGFADGALLLTDAMIRKVVEGLNGATSIDCIIKAAGLDGHDQGFYAVARAIGHGLLTPTRRGLIDRCMTVRRATLAGPP